MLKSCFLGLFASLSLYGIDHTYIGSGTDPLKNESYTVTATFTQDQNGVYQATWDEVQMGKEAHYKGTGLEHGNSMSFVFQNQNDPSDMGLQIYTIKDHTLEGQFVLFNKNLVGTEKLASEKKSH